MHYLQNHRLTETLLFGIRCEEKYYQLEEMEDKENCTTELYLKTDRTVEFGDTDGPRWTAAVGHWQVTPNTNDFTMEVTRSYHTGQDNSDMGEFAYEVKRVFRGEMTNVGASVGITGTAHAVENGVDQQEVGFFNMIDATDERVGEDKKV